MRGDSERIRDILDAIERIERYTLGNLEAFEQNELIQNWVVSHIQMIGEAANYISKELQGEHPEVPWTKIIGMRNILVHSYFNIDLDVVKAVLEQDLPNLKSQIVHISEELENTPQETPSIPPDSADSDKQQESEQ